jgi:hypothetical protein
MGLFKKKENSERDSKKINPQPQAIPVLPELPKLPDFPGVDSDNSDYADMDLPQLPSFPNNSLGNKFSQNTIKEAVAGEKEVEPEEADELSSEFDEEEAPMMQESPEEKIARVPMNQSKSYPGFSKQYTMQKKVEPVFIRLDKFEESLEVFNEAKEQISEIEHLLRNVKELKAKEEEELNSWENKIQEIKKQIEKVDQDVFSKI